MCIAGVGEEGGTEGGREEKIATSPSYSYSYFYPSYSYSYFYRDSVLSSDARLHVTLIHFLVRCAVC